MGYLETIDDDIIPWQFKTLGAVVFMLLLPFAFMSILGWGPVPHDPPPRSMPVLSCDTMLCDRLGLNYVDVKMQSAAINDDGHWSLSFTTPDVITQFPVALAKKAASDFVVRELTMKQLRELLAARQKPAWWHVPSARGIKIIAIDTPSEEMQILYAPSNETVCFHQVSKTRPTASHPTTSQPALVPVPND
jgi:hypothetical protein